jgi:chemotaxis protein methyltransferase CheR
MQPTQHPLLFRPRLTEKDFGRISTYIQQHVGIRLPLSKLILVESRLIKRILQLNLNTFSDYVSYVFGKDGADEQAELIDFLCTNKTDFFREDHHFKFLERHILSNPFTRSMNVWSAACSSGEEPYTLAMVLEELKHADFNGAYNILATDISSAVLAKARKGQYTADKLTVVSKPLQKKYFSFEANQGTIDTALKKHITFQRFNLVDDASYTTLNRKFDFIFCRNVLIYFDQPTQNKVLTNLVSKLAPGGILFLGHSETLMGRNFNLVQLQPTIYQRTHA